MLVGSQWHFPQTPAQVKAPLKSHSQRETEPAPPQLQTPHTNCISKVQGAQKSRRDVLQQHSMILPTSMLVNHLSPPSLLASGHARSSRAAGTKVTSTCRESEGRFNGLIARHQSWGHSTAYLRRAILPSLVFHPPAKASAIPQHYLQELARQGKQEPRAICSLSPAQRTPHL